MHTVSKHKQLQHAPTKAERTDDRLVSDVEGNTAALVPLTVAAIYWTPFRNRPT